MFSKYNVVFLAIPNPQNKRILYEGRVIELDDMRAVIRFDENLDISVGTEVVLFAEIHGKFLQQGAAAATVSSTEMGTTIDFNLLGDAVSADQRGSYRTSVISWQVQVRVDNNVGCQLADVSPEGIGVISPSPLMIGATVDVALQYEDNVIAGPLRVQTAKILPSGKLRFGLFVPDRRSPLRPSLLRLAEFAQQHHVKRFSGAA